MERFVKGDIVVVPFPFSDLSASKRRPALVLASLHGEDVILCQITSQNVRDEYAIPLREDGMESGRLRTTSNIRPNRIFTASREIIIYRVGKIKSNKIQEVKNKIINILE